MTGRGSRDGVTINLTGGPFNSDDLRMMQGAIDAVCVELGITDTSNARDAVARRVVAAYETGRRQPLNLVHAGLGACYA